MLKEINYRVLNKDETLKSYGKGAVTGLTLVTTFVIVAIVTVVLYKLYSSKTGDITLPGGFKMKFTT